MRSPGIVLSSRLNNWWLTEHYPNVWYDIDIQAHPYAISLCSLSSWATNWWYPTMFIVFITISDTVNKTWSSFWLYDNDIPPCSLFSLSAPWQNLARALPQRSSGWKGLQHKLYLNLYIFFYIFALISEDKDIKLLWTIKFKEPKLLDEELFVNCKYQWPLIIVSRRERLDLSQLYLFTSCSGQHS